MVFSKVLKWLKASFKHGTALKPVKHRVFGVPKTLHFRRNPPAENAKVLAQIIRKVFFLLRWIK